MAWCDGPEGVSLLGGMALLEEVFLWKWVLRSFA